MDEGRDARGVPPGVARPGGANAAAFRGEALAGQRVSMARSLALLFGAGATLALASLVLPHWPEVNEVGVGIPALIGYAAAFVLMARSGRVPVWAFHVILALGTVLISVAAYFGRGGAASAAYATLYVWIALFAFHFFSRGTAMAHLTLAGLAYGFVVLLGRGYVAQWVIPIGMALVAGSVVGWLFGQVRALAQTDPLTGILNRRAWESALSREFARSRRDGRPLSMAVIDLDDFKALNDRKGHQAGDRLLKESAAAWSGQLRETDILARCGGDEFAAILPNCPLENAREVAERLRAAMPAGHSASVGIACWDGSETAGALYERADAALYEAKRAGRGRVSVAVVK